MFDVTKSSSACEARHSDPGVRSADAILLARGDGNLLNVSFSLADVVGTMCPSERGSVLRSLDRPMLHRNETTAEAR